MTTNCSKLLATNNNIIPIWISGQGTIIHDLAIYHQQPGPQPDQKWEPLPYDAAIFEHTADVRLENTFRRNPTVGISCENTGRLSVNRLFGQPRKIGGISLNQLHDVTRIDNFHFWRYWSMDPAVSEYLFRKAITIKSYRSDNAFSKT
jgi:hypothetical protein